MKTPTHPCPVRTGEFARLPTLETGATFLGRLGSGKLFYGRIIDPRDMHMGIVLTECYSYECPDGTRGNLPIIWIAEIIPVEEFESARAKRWSPEPAQLWVPAHLANGVKDPEGLKASVRAQPPAIQELLVRFPPHCLVASVEPILIPHEGTRGIVTAYSAPPNEPVGLVVQQRPGYAIEAVCSPTRFGRSPTSAAATRMMSDACSRSGYGQPPRGMRSSTPHPPWTVEIVP